MQAHIADGQSYCTVQQYNFLSSLNIPTGFRAVVKSFVLTNRNN